MPKYPRGTMVEVESTYGTYRGALTLDYRVGGDCQVAQKGAPLGYYHLAAPSLRRIQRAR